MHCVFVCLFAAGLDDPHSGDDESSRREHAAANAAREAGATQLAEREHKRSQAQTRTLACTGGLARMRVVFRTNDAHPMAYGDWPWARRAAVPCRVAELSPRCSVPLDQRSPKGAGPRRGFCGEHTYPRASVESAPCIRYRSTGWVPQRFIEVMTACWDNGNSRFLRHLALACEATQPLLSAQSGQPRPHHTRVRDVGAGDRIECAGHARGHAPHCN